MDANDRRRRAAREATQWWLRLNESSGGASRSTREDFNQWLRESPLHVAEMLRVGGVDQSLGRFEHWDRIEIEPFSRADEEPISPTAEGGSRRPWKVVLAMAATITAVAMGLWLKPLLWGDSISTDRAERREVALNDGSVLQLDPETLVRVRLGSHTREVNLIRGRALFRVSHDAQRPFFVEANNTVVRVMGTVFGVENQGTSVVVTVSDGKVAVAGAQTSAPTVLTGGEQVSVSPSGTSAPVKEVDAARVLSWAEGRLIFESTPLSEVVAAFNHYNHLQLHVQGAELARRPVSAVFESSDPETLLAFIQAGARVVVTRNANQQIVIAPRDAAH